METLASDPVQVEPDRVVFEMTLAEWHCKPLGTVHGGVVATVADTVLHPQSTPAGIGYTTQGTTIGFLRPATVDTGRIRCEGTALNVGRRTACAAAPLTDRLLTHATTCQIFPLGDQQPKANGRHPARTTDPAI
ncbi:PaaI family thioesterase [Streptomyces sp. NPDC003016]